MIQRWDIDGRPIIRRFDDGEYVKVADHKALVNELVEALEASRKAINTLDEDALGMYMREDGHGGIDYWPYTVELLQRIDTVLAKARGEAR